MCMTELQQFARYYNKINFPNPHFVGGDNYSAFGHMDCRSLLDIGHA